MAKLNTLLDKQTVLGQKLERCIINGKKTSLDKRSFGFYENKISELKKLWTEFDANDTTVREAILKEPGDYEYITSDKYSDLDVKYNEYVGELTEGMHQKSVAPSNPSGGSQPHTSSRMENAVNSPSPHLPKIPLPLFNGQYDSWLSFHDIFVSLIHENTHLQPVQKLHYLKGCLVGEAKGLLKHTPTTANDYIPAWEKLKARYENKRLLVNTQLKNLLNQSKIVNENSKTLKVLLDTTEECLQQLQLLGIDTSSWDTILVYIIVQKLPFMTVKLWEEELGDTPQLPKFEDFKKFLLTRFRILESVTHTMGHAPVPKHPSQTSKSYHVTNNSTTCPACNGDHYVIKCQKFINMDVSTRRKCINTSGRCFNCYSNKHVVKQCPKRPRCDHCNGKHHPLLHTVETNNRRDTKRTADAHNAQKENQTAETSTQNQEQFSFFTAEEDKVILATTLIKTRDRNGKSITLRGLVDPGSQSSFITEKVSKRLGLHGKPANVEINGLNKSQTAFANRRVQVELSSCNKVTTSINVDMLVIPKITDLLPSSFGCNKNWEHLKGLDLADPMYWKPNPIDILLGAQVFAEILKGPVKRGQKGAPIAIETVLGWFILGNETSTDAEKTNVFTITTKADKELNNLLKRFWEQEEAQTKRVLKPEDENCEQIYEKTHTRLEDGKYMVKLPFRNQSGPSLGHSKQQALIRFQHLEKKLGANPKLKEEYSKCLNEYVTLGHMTEAHASHEDGYYIPHHAVFKDSTTTKLRVVFDASAKTSNGKSLNEQMLVGPTIQPKLFSTLLKWRKYKIAMTADIEKMYRMIFIHPDHQLYQKILWRDPKNNELKEYQLKTVTFGTSSAPYLAIRTVQQLVDDEWQNWPLAAKSVKTDFYVDDLLTGADSVDEAKKLQKQFIELLRSGGFNLRKWASNNVEVLEELSVEDREIKDIFNFDDRETIKTLGIRWLPSSDCFTFTVEAKLEKGAQTKRKILSEVASLYDPLGWIAPVVIVAKIIIQSLWISGCNWDEKINDQTSQQWTHFKENLYKLQQIRIPRWVNCTMDTVSMQLHGFCDASTHAYAGVVYLRVKTENGGSMSRLLASKTKVAPIKPTTIPRLELNAAVLLAKLIKQIMQDMQLQNISVCAWSDSTIALQWIKSHPARWKTYVANRTVEIQDLIEPTCWRHVPTDQNPADIASRGASTESLISNQLWWSGPTWLTQDESHWPNFILPIKQTELESKRNACMSFVSKVDDEIFAHYSSFQKLVRTIAYVKRFINNCKTKNQRTTGLITIDELQMASNCILKLVQMKTFTEEYNSLKKGESVGRKSQLLSLTPFLDHDDIIRVGGRLENASIPYKRKHPIVLPKTHHITRLIINQIHLDTLHGGVGLVLNTSRNLYWIVNGKKTIAHQINKCNTCIRHRQKIRSQLMGSLPAYRVNVSQAFTQVGVDYAGPIMIKASPLRTAKIIKGYFCIFVCMTTKAIHIELVSDLTSSAFLAAFKRFVARRGLCSDVYSDCGTNFKGAIPVLDKDFKVALKEATPLIAKYLETNRVKWHFNPPGAPHFGGIWEAGVKSVKHHLRRIVGKSIFTFEEYYTLLTQIEAVLNSRPLCRTENDTEDLAILTPGHFLIGRPLNAVPETQFVNRKDYLNKLQQKPKWLNVQENLQVGDVVVVKEENTAPTYWPLGKVEQVFPGKDGLIRVVQIKTRTGVMRRPVTKLCKLTTDEKQKETAN